ncbi:MAG: hypothetical protein M1358_15720 [Chloroflexi bacterium]|nr:hypothetical protein [Chloroflexota bacterium]
MSRQRLQNDYDKVRQLVIRSGGELKLISVSGNPPTQYVLEYNCRSVALDSGGQVVYRNRHRVEITLSHEYPWDDYPRAKLLTPVFNPHVFPDQSIYLGYPLKWKPSESLETVVLNIGALLQLDPKAVDFVKLANEKAGEWAKKHLSELPLDTARFGAPR